MITLLTAYTHELEEPQKAAKEILDQLNRGKKPLKNSIALLFCHSVFVAQGVARVICESLPFEVLGCSCQSFALREAADEIMLTVAVLTSDDVEFAAGISAPLTEENLDTELQALYRRAAAPFNAAPALVFALLPTMLNSSGEHIAAAVDRVCKGIPVFGTAALDMDTKVRRPWTIFHGEAYSDRVALLFFKGPVNPRFFSLPFAGKYIFAQDAVITGVAGNLITGINNKPAVSFIENLGLIEPNSQGGLIFPLLIDYHDGTGPYVAIVHSVTADGALITSRNLQVGGALSIGSVSIEDVLESARTLAQAVKETGDGSGLIIFSCFLRSIVMGGKPLAEIEVIQKELAGFPAPYLFLYSGGELCPRYTESGDFTNRFYQYALVACLL
jgi:hypothetical protein